MKKKWMKKTRMSWIMAAVSAKWRLCLAPVRNYCSPLGILFTMTPGRHHPHDLLPRSLAEGEA